MSEGAIKSQFKYAVSEEVSVLGPDEDYCDFVLVFDQDRAIVAMTEEQARSLRDSLNAEIERYEQHRTAGTQFLLHNILG